MEAQIKEYAQQLRDGLGNSHASNLVMELEALLKDKERLDWLDANGFTAYRNIDPIDGLSGHCVLVNENMKPRQGIVSENIRAGIDAAMAGANNK